MSGASAAGSLVRKLRPAKVRSALRRRWFEQSMSRCALEPVPGLVDLGTAYGGWTMPTAVLQSSWTCYSVGAGEDVEFDLALVHQYGMTVRSIDPVAEYVEQAAARGDGEPRFSVHRAAIARQDGPIRMQVTHDPTSRSVSAAGLYDSHDYVEVPGRTLASLMGELGDDRIDLLKLDVEGSEYDLVPTLDLRALGVTVFAAQLHHTGTVAQARALIAHLREQGYRPVAIRPVVKMTFLRVT